MITVKGKLYMTGLEILIAKLYSYKKKHYINEKENIYNARWQGSSYYCFSTYHCFSTSAHSRGVSILFKKKQQSFIIHNVH